MEAEAGVLRALPGLFLFEYLGANVFHVHQER